MRKETLIASGILTVAISRKGRQINLGIVDVNGNAISIAVNPDVLGKPATLKVRLKGPLPIIAGRGFILFENGTVGVTMPDNKKIQAELQFYMCPDDITVMRGDSVHIWTSERIPGPV